MFGEFVRDRRLELGLSLRKFCLTTGLDPSNWSKIERKLLPPPTDEETLKRISRVLQIEQGSPAWEKLEVESSVDAGQIPKYIASDEELVKFLPAFFRSIGGVRPMREEIKELLEQLRKAYQ